MTSSATKPQHPPQRKRKTTELENKEQNADRDQDEKPESTASPLPSSVRDTTTRNQQAGKRKKQKTEEKRSVKQDDEQSSSSTRLEEQGHQDTPPLELEAISHKERRKRRKLERKVTTVPTNGLEGQSRKEEETGPKSKGTVDSRKVETIFTTTCRSSYSIWVGNLLFTTTPQELAAFFEPCGKITRLNMPSGKREHENNKGFAYVDFETEAGVEKAMVKSESALGGRKLLIKRATDYSGRPSASSITLSSAVAASIPPTTLMKSARKILDHQKQPPAPCLYFGNLGFEATSESISSMLQAHHQAQLAWKPKAIQSNLDSKLKSKKPPSEEDEDESSCEDSKKAADPKDLSNAVGICKVRMGTFEDTGRCKGFAFVDFESVAHATNALLNTKNHRLDGRKLQVEYASADAVKRGGGSVRSIQQNRSSRNYDNDHGDSDHHKPNKPFKTSSKPIKFEKPHPRSDALPTRTTKMDATPQAAPPTNQERHQREPAFNGHQGGDLHQDVRLKKEYRGRQKPGAVLANARRAPMGIVKNPEQIGKKTVFA